MVRRNFMMNEYNLSQRQVAEEHRSDATEAARKTLVWIGSVDRDEVVEAFEFCAGHFPQIAVRSNLQHFSDFPADQVTDVIVVRTDRSNPPSLVDHLFDRMPYVRWWTLSGSGCEGEHRTGTPWAGFENVYWHRWNQVMPTWFEPADSIGATAQRTMRQTSRKTIVMLGRDAGLTNDIGGWLARDGGTVLCFSDPDDAKIFNVDFCIWDDSVAPPTSVTNWKCRLARFNTSPPNSVKHIWLAGFPRTHQWRTAKLAGVDNLISKPFNLSAFSYIINKYREAVKPLGCLDA